MTKTNLKYDIIILGAGPAGSAAALALRASKLRVALIDKAVFPRHKTCGDAIPGKTQKFLREVWPGIDEALANAPFGEEIRSAEVFATNGLSFRMDWKLKAYNMKRSDFDNLLLKEVKNEGSVEVYEGCAVKQIKKTDQGFEIEAKDGSVFETKMLIACDGANSICAKQLMPQKTNRDQYGFAVAAYYSGVDCPANINLVFPLKEFNPGYFWIFPLGDNLYNIGYGMLGKPPKGASLKGNLKKIIASEKSIQKHFSKAQLDSDIFAFGLPMGGKEFKPLVASGLMLCGDAANLIDPLQGHGIDKAVRSGILAAQTAAEAIRSGNTSEDGLRSYQEGIYAEFGPELKKNFKVMELLSGHAWILNGLTRIAQWQPMANVLRKLLYV